MPDPIALSSDAELRALVERALNSNYELDRELGRGGMGIVYRARDRRLKRMVAVKLLPPELGFRREIRSRFLREAETAAQLSHPHIVPIYTVDERDGLVYFVMACVDGVTLGKRLAEEGRLPIPEARRILHEVADALAYAHARGVIHRDIKPDNILLGEHGAAMVTDFGIARAVQEENDSRLTATGVAIGTPAYMSPEQAAGDREIDGRSDLYSLGIVGYQMLTGHLPFEASGTAAMLMKHIAERPAPVSQLRPDAPPDLAATVMTLLEKDPERRFPNAATLVSALSGDLDAIPAAVSQSTPPPVPWGPPATSPIPAAPAAATGAAAPTRFTTPTPDEVARWSAPEVQRFRGRFARYAFVNAVIVVASLFTNTNFIGVTVIWSIILAVQYSKLWSAGYDWRDVFRQPRHRRLIDVASETIEETQALFDRSRRHELRARAQERSALAQVPGGAAASAPGDFGRYADRVQRAEQDRAEIVRIVAALPPSDRTLVDGVVPAADGLLQRIRGLATALSTHERTFDPAAPARVEQEITRLEAQANPLDVAGSEDRVRRLALLKRERRALADATRRRDETTSRLESCAIALQGMRVDVLRLRAGGVAAATQHITQLTDRARSLAEDVDAAVQGVDEARRGASAGGRRG